MADTITGQVAADTAPPPDDWRGSRADLQRLLHLAPEIQRLLASGRRGPRVVPALRRGTSAGTSKMTTCDGPGCQNVLTGQQTRWCGPECLRLGTLAGRKTGQPDRRSQHRRDYGFREGQEFGEASLICEVPYEMPGKPPVRGALLRYSCDGVTEFAVRLSNLAVPGRITSCGTCRRGRHWR